MRGAQDAHVHAEHLVAAERHHFAVLDHVEQACLQWQRHVADLIQEQRAAVGLQDPSRVALAGSSGEGARLVAEQFTFDQRLGNGSAVHGYEWLVGPAAGVMDGARAETLAGAGFPQQQHRDIAIHHAAQDVDVVQHRSIARVQAGQRAAAVRWRRRRRLRRPGDRCVAFLRYPRGAARAGGRRSMHGREPAPQALRCRQRLRTKSLARRQLQEGTQTGIEGVIDPLATQRFAVARPEQLERATIGAADDALLIERQNPLAGRADKLGAAVEAHQVKFLARPQECAVLHVLCSHIDQRQCVRLGVRCGAGDIERGE